MNKLTAYEIFIKVAELESFTKTAEHLNLPKASVSQYISELEVQIGTQLFFRTTRQVKLTQDGINFLNRIQDFIEEHNEIENMFLQQNNKLKGKIRIDMPIGFSKNLFIPNLPDFFKKHPEIQIELSSTDRFVDVIGEGFDCVVRVGNLSDSSLIAKKTGELKIVNCASKDYIKKYGKPKTLDDLKDHYIIEYSSNFNSTRYGFEYYDIHLKKDRNIKMNYLLTVNNSEAYTQACLNNMGIIQVPLIGAKNNLDKGVFIEVLPQYKTSPMPVHILFPNKKNLPIRVRVFMDWLEELLKKY